jgi:hypothetical protein
MKSKADKIKAQLLKPKAVAKSTPLHLGTGSTLLNLALSGKAKGGLLAGHSYLFCGDSKSGKTLLAHYCLAEASVDSNFKDYRLIFDGPEDGALFDLEKFFGKKLLAKLEPPRRDKDGEPLNSFYLDDFYFNLDDAAKAGKPFVYVLDSMDALQDPADRKKFLDQKMAARKKERGEGKDEDVAGSFGLAKAKKNSSNLNWVNSFLSKTNSVLIIIAQSRDKIGFGYGNPKTRGGGRAMTFYATGEIWTSIAGDLETTAKGLKWKQGITSRVRIVKNRQTGQDRTLDLNVYTSSGLDDLGSMVDWLFLVKHWRKPKGKEGEETGKREPVKDVEAPEFDWSGSKEKLIARIEEEGSEEKLRRIVSRVWWDIEEEVAVNRKNKYA